MAMTLRATNREDEDFLWEAQCHAALLDPHTESAVALRSHPVLSRYVAGWGRAGDSGIVAELEGKPVGAAWCRLFPAESPGWGWVDEGTPELSVAVLPEFRNQGVGTSMLMRLLEVSGGKDKRISLAVRSTNPALRLYLRLGFRVVPERDFLNRAGILSHVLVKNAS